jgi:hypothetical protein
MTTFAPAIALVDTLSHTSAPPTVNVLETSIFGKFVNTFNEADDSVFIPITLLVFIEPPRTSKLVEMIESDAIVSQLTVENEDNFVPVLLVITSAAVKFLVVIFEDMIDDNPSLILAADKLAVETLVSLLIFFELSTVKISEIIELTVSASDSSLFVVIFLLTTVWLIVTIPGTFITLPVTEFVVNISFLIVVPDLTRSKHVSVPVRSI